MWVWGGGRVGVRASVLQALGYAFPHAYRETGPDILAPPWGTPALAQVEQALPVSVLAFSGCQGQDMAPWHCPLLFGFPPPHPNPFLWPFVSP